jgi:hypothetical protein
VSTTASQTGDGPADSSYPCKVALAVGTLVEKSADLLCDGEWQKMAAFFVSNFKIDTGGAPFTAVWKNSTPPSPELGQQMCELVP